jgi:L-2-hydroxyglutarate oxidase LhgO
MWGLEHYLTRWVQYAGIRANITGPGEAPGDFIIHGHQKHGIHDLVNLYGIEPPGLTAAPSIANHVMAVTK